MKNTILSFLFFLFCLPFSKALDASISYATFKSPSQNYVEIYLFVIGKSVEFIPVDSLLSQAGVEVVILFKKDGEIVKFDKYNLSSPVSVGKDNFADLKRYALENGEYELEVSINDLNKPGNAIRHTGKLLMNYKGNELLQSDIQLLSTIKKAEAQNVFVKSGYYMESLPFNFYNKSTSKLIFYSEIYNTDQTIKDEFLVTYGVEEVRNGQAKSVMIGHKKRQPKPVNVLLLQMDISQLPSGNYNLFVEIKNRENELLSRKVTGFQRSNPYYQASLLAMEEMPLNNEFVMQLNEDELRYSLKAIAPLVKDADVELLNTLIAKKDTAAQQRFLFNFWVNENPNHPDQIYHQFMEVAKAVDKMYAGGFGFGFESDRGYIYIKYGRPDDMIQVDTDPSAPPYEIWVYNDFPKTNQTNVRFLFYEPGLATNYVLLHSTARGEINNPQWQLELYRNAPQELQGSNYIDGTQMQDNFNRYASRYFNEF